MAVQRGPAGHHVPHEVGALLLEGPDDDGSHMFLLHRALDYAEKGKYFFSLRILNIQT